MPQPPSHPSLTRLANARELDPCDQCTRLGVSWARRAVCTRRPRAGRHSPAPWRGWPGPCGRRGPTEARSWFWRCDRAPTDGVLAGPQHLRRGRGRHMGAGCGCGSLPLAVCSGVWADQQTSLLIRNGLLIKVTPTALPPPPCSPSLCTVHAPLAPSASLLHPLPLHSLCSPLHHLLPTAPLSANLCSHTLLLTFPCLLSFSFQPGPLSAAQPSHLPPFIPHCSSCLFSAAPSISPASFSTAAQQIF